ncbi:hypothetical protein GE21DRAFT_1223559, partial [Neurospora crassa]
SRTFNIFNLNNKDAPNNINEAIAVITKYYSKKGDGPSFTFKPLTIVGKEY